MYRLFQVCLIARGKDSGDPCTGFQAEWKGSNILEYLRAQQSNYHVIGGQ